MSWKNLVGMTLVGGAMFLIGWLTPFPSRTPAPIAAPVVPAQPPEKETAFATLPQPPVNQEPAQPRAGKVGEQLPPSPRGEELAQLDKRLQDSFSRVVAALTPPTDPRCAPPAPRCEPPPAPPCPDPSKTHTLTIYNGPRVEQDRFVLRQDAGDGRWEFQTCDVYVRDGSRSPWYLQGTYGSRHRAEEIACSLRARGNLTEIRPRCR